MIDKVISYVKEKLGSEDFSHNIDHVLRVYELSKDLSNGLDVNEEVVALSSLLHDVDDYKLFGNSNNLSNAKYIMDELGIGEITKNKVLDIINNMGYKNSLKGIRPTTIEGMIVSDADMLDGMGVNGIIRSISYALSSKGNGVIFNKDIFPNVNIGYSEYNKYGTTHDTDGAINHMFEKILKLPNLMMTNKGKAEAKERTKIIILFLRELFREEKCNDWDLFLDEYIKDNNL